MEGSVGYPWLQNQSMDNLQQGNYVYKIGIYGWRKRCLYIFLLLLTIMLVVNVALTLWVVKVLDFSTNGMGNLRILKNGIRMEGEAHFLHTLISNDIRAPKHSSLVISSDRNLTLKARDGAGREVSSMIIGNHALESLANRLSVKNRRGKTLFLAADDRIEVAADVLKVTGTGGAIFQGSIQTTEVKADYQSDLVLAAPTRKINIEAPDGVYIESASSDIHVTSLNSIKLESRSEPITLMSSEIMINSLPIVDVSESKANAGQVFQLCVCENGMLFLSPSDEQCIYNERYCKKK